MKRAVFELFMKQALECVLDFCRNTQAVSHNRYFFLHQFPDFWNFTCVYFETPCILKISRSFSKNFEKYFEK